ncbi:hypothetical protein [Mesorhizobium sp. B261B1A]|uniref:hypothetical protein n=1 Tax=Mesorhizobium sp. B261B1A TaxID=2876671 RepID=UPI001CD0E907|nr:hypothetical protein [Mesorhizobium sp. B261B1A]MCA0057123.1 hypothetical protein [Mesorhizobium sp. B261B1A]
MLNDNETIYRCALYPRMTNGDIVPPEKAISDFSEEKDQEGRKVYTISVGRGSMLPAWTAVHDYGCRTAVESNAVREKYKGAPLVRGEDTLHYIGAYKLDVAAVLNAPRKFLDLGVVHHEMTNLPEHCNIVLRRNTVEARRIEVSAERTGIIIHLRQSLYEPERHICDCDSDLTETLQKIKLTVVKDTGEALLTTG